MNRPILTRTISALALFYFTGQAAWATNLAPHRAFYTLEASRLDSGGGISSISGKLAYEITGSDCDGYSVSYRVANRYVQGESGPLVSDVQITSFESGDGLELDLQQKQLTNARLDTESRVKVKKPGADQEGEAVLTTLETKKFRTAAKAMFPTDFQKQLLLAAVKGETRYDAMVYDGSEGEKSSRAISFIGTKHNDIDFKDAATDEASRALGKVAYWPVTVSYYTLDAKGDEAPIYQAGFNMLENGISTDLLLDYGSYALKGKLSKIEVLKSETCN